MRKFALLLALVVGLSGAAGAHDGGGHSGGGGHSSGGGGHWNGGGGGNRGSMGGGESRPASAPNHTWTSPGHSVGPFSHAAPMGGNFGNFGTFGHSSVNGGVHVVTTSQGNRQIVPNNTAFASNRGGAMVSAGHTSTPTLTIHPTGVNTVGFVHGPGGVGVLRPVVFNPGGFRNPFFYSSNAFFSGYLIGFHSYHPSFYYNPFYLGFYSAFGFGLGYYDSGFYGSNYYSDGYNNGYDAGYGNGYNAGTESQPPPDQAPPGYSIPATPPVAGQSVEGSITTITDHEICVQSTTGLRVFMLTDQTRVYQVLQQGDQVRVHFDSSSGYEPEAIDIVKLDGGNQGPLRGTP